MHFVFEARQEDGEWIAVWKGDLPRSPGGAIISNTVATTTKEALADLVKDGIECHLSIYHCTDEFTFEIVYN